jgi:predicted MPP superfamily phosphohydrolase
MTPPPQDRIVHIADVHFWRVLLNPFKMLNKRALGNFNVWLRRRHEFVQERAEAFSDYVASLGIDQVLLTGDFTSTACDSEFEAAKGFIDGLASRGLRLTLMAGNHDVYTFESLRRRRFERYFGDYLPSAGHPASARLAGGASLVVVPTVCPNVISSKGRINNEEIGRTQELLAECEGPVLVAGHYPFLHETYGYATKPDRRLRNAAALHEALGKLQQKILYVSGHVHRFSYVTDGRYPNLSQLTTGAFFRHDQKSGRQGEIAEIHVGDGAFRVFHHTNNGQWHREEAEPRLHEGG